MKDNTFELLTKMYNEFSAKFDKIDSRLDKIEITLENDIKINIQTLHEREAINSEKLDDHSEQLENINNKLDYLAQSINSHDKRL